MRFYSPTSIYQQIIILHMYTRLRQNHLRWEGSKKKTQCIMETILKQVRCYKAPLNVWHNGQYLTTTLTHNLSICLIFISSNFIFYHLECNKILLIFDLSFNLPNPYFSLPFSQVLLSIILQRYI